MKIKDLSDNLASVGLGKTETDLSERLCEEGQTEELIHLLRKFRCNLLDEMHESQRKVDRMDRLIHRIEKELIK